MPPLLAMHRIFCAASCSGAYFGSKAHESRKLFARRGSRGFLSNGTRDMLFLDSQRDAHRRASARPAQLLLESLASPLIWQRTRGLTRDKHGFGEFASGIHLVL